MSEQGLVTIFAFAVAAHGSLALFATLKLNQREVLSRAGRAFWLVFIWGVPIIGVAALHVIYHTAWGGHSAHGVTTGTGVASDSGGSDGGCGDGGC